MNLNLAGGDPEKEARTWAMLLHFSTLLTFPLPVVGLVAPILIWQIKKDQYPVIDRHGKIVVNWILSAFIYSLVSSLLMLVFVGFFLLMALGLASIAFAIIGGIKANNGEVWDYPLSIRFLS